MTPPADFGRFWSQREPGGNNVAAAVEDSPLARCRLQSPVGALLLAASAMGLCRVDFQGSEGEDCAGLEKVGLEWSAAAKLHLLTAAEQLAEYFQGRRTRFVVALDFRTGTPFEQQVWKSLASIPYGCTVTYGELAKRLRRPGAFRAVGQACRKNPLPVVLPCHRVVAVGGKLGGYSAGLERKAFLLSMEAKVRFAEARLRAARG